LSHFLCALSELFLKFSDQFVILALCIGEIVVGQLGVLLFELTFDLIPRAFELEFVHVNNSAVLGLSVLSFPQLFPYLALAQAAP
jgi:hypothetical protein